MVLLRFGMKWYFRDGKVDHYRGTEDTAATLEMLGK